MSRILALAWAFSFAPNLGFAGTESSPLRDSSPASAAVTLAEDAGSFTLGNGLIIARIEKRSGTLFSLSYKGLELLARNRGGANGGYWSSVGTGRPGPSNTAVVRINPVENEGARAEISCQLHNDPSSPTAPVDADYRYALARGESCLYVYAALKHQPGYPAFGVGEARYCLKLNPDVFDYLSVDADRQRLMPSGYDWDHGAPLNVKEARRMTTGVHKGEAEHKYDYSAVLSEAPAYGWSSTRDKVGLWLINPSTEYLGGGPTKAELTGHLDVNPGGLPTLLNMWVGSHYGGTTISVATNEAWTKVVGPFALFCNSSLTLARSDTNAQRALWQDALAQAAREAGQWPYAWVSDPDYPPSAKRASVSGELVLRDPFAPGATMSNIWMGLAAPDYKPSRLALGFGARRQATNSPASGLPATNAPERGPAYVYGRAGLPAYIEWQRDAKFYQFWTRADAQGRFVIRHVRAGTYTLHAIADGVLGEFTLADVTVTAGDNKSLGQLAWTPLRFGRTLWEIGVPDRTAREFRHGDHYWHWGLYFDYPKEFPNDINFVIGRSDWRRDWNYVQPPRIDARKVPAVGEEEEQNQTATPQRAPSGRANVRSTTWSISFDTPESTRGTATLRLAFCGTHVGCHVEVFVNGKSIGDTGPLPSTSAMQRDGIRAYWVEKDLSFDANLLARGTNVIKLLSHANSWSQGVMYDCVRLELNHAEPEH